MTKAKKVNGIDIEALLAKKEAISSEAVKAAIAKLETQKKEEQERLVLRHLESIQQNTAAAVENLRRARKNEKAGKNYLTALAEAENVFYQDADYAKYEKALNEASNEFYRQSC